MDTATLKVKTRGEIMVGMTIKVELNCGTLYITVNRDEEGNLFEVFARMGKAGGCASSQLEAIGRLVSLSLRSDICVESIIGQLRNIRCPNLSCYKGKEYTSCADAIAQTLAKVNGNNKSAE